MSRRAWVMFVALSVVWGMPYLLIRIAVAEIPPEALVFLRSAVAAIVLVPIAVARGGLRTAVRAWRPVLMFAVLEMALPWFLLGWAQQHLASGFTGVLVASTPIVAIVIGLAMGEKDRPARGRVVGMAVALLGVASLLGVELVAGDARAIAAVAVVIVCYAAAPMVVSRSLVAVPGEAVTACALMMTALVYAPIATPTLVALPQVSTRALVAVAVLGTVSTAAALLLFFALIRDAGPHRALVVTYANPVVAVALGAWVADETVTPGMVVGLLLILLGCSRATRRSGSSRLPVDVVDHLRDDESSSTAARR